MERIFEGKDDKFMYIVDEYSDLVTRICYLRLCNTQDIEDCYQNVFLKLYCNEIINKSLEEIKKWLITVTIHECIDWKRKLFHRRHMNLDELVTSDIKPAEYELIEYIRELPKLYGVVLYLHYYEGYKIKEISVLINKNENTVKTMMRKAKKLMKGVLENEGFERV